MKKTRKKGFYYLLLGLVIFIWGIDPIVLNSFFEYYSSSVLSVIFTFSSALLFLIISRKRLREINRSFLVRALPIYLINAVAMILQRTGLQYTTPSSYAFLEHLSCAAAPIAMLVFTRRPPSRFEIASVALCITGCFIFTGADLSAVGIGELLCALAGILIGISTAATGVYAKELDTTLFNTIYLLVYFAVSLFSAVLLGAVSLNGAPLEAPRFSAAPEHLLPVVLFGILSIGICWLLRTAAVKEINVVAVAVVSPLSAVISGALSVALGTDSLSAGSLIGAALILASVLISSLSDINAKKRHKKEPKRP